jgi:hypothetical protein
MNKEPSAHTSLFLDRLVSRIGATGMGEENRFAGLSAAFSVQWSF